MSEVFDFEYNVLQEMLIVNHQEGFSYNMCYEDDVYSVTTKLNKQQSTISALKKENKELKEKLDDVLNEQQVNIEELQQKYDKLCIEMANIYSEYIFMKEFSEDTNPNEAVKHILRELMQKTKEVR